MAAPLRDRMGGRCPEVTAEENMAVVSQPPAAPLQGETVWGIERDAKAHPQVQPGELTSAHLLVSS